ASAVDGVVRPMAAVVDPPRDAVHPAGDRALGPVAHLRAGAVGRQTRAPRRLRAPGARPGGNRAHGELRILQSAGSGAVRCATRRRGAAPLYPAAPRRGGSRAPLEAGRSGSPPAVHGTAHAASRLADVVRCRRPRRLPRLARAPATTPARRKSRGGVPVRGGALSGGTAALRAAGPVPVPLYDAGRACREPRLV